MALPIDALAYDSLFTALSPTGGIKAGVGGYNSTLAPFAYLADGAPTKETAVHLLRGKDEWLPRQPINAKDDFYVVAHLFTFSPVVKNPATKTQIEQKMATQLGDIVKALMVDRYRGGNAIDTIVGRDVVYDFDSDPCFAVLTVKLHVRTARHNRFSK